MGPKQRRRRNPAPVDDLHVRVGVLLREARIKKGLSQAQLGFPHSTRAMISAVELGKVAASLKGLAFYAKKLGVPLRSLIPDE
jgi:transcriptional regulator with XRE-family HTH domain